MGENEMNFSAVTLLKQIPIYIKGLLKRDEITTHNFIYLNTYRDEMNTELIEFLYDDVIHYGIHDNGVDITWSDDYNVISRLYNWIVSDKYEQLDNTEWKLRQLLT